MTRGRTGTQTAADTAAHRGSAALLELLFDSGALRLCIGPWSITAGGNLYVHTGAALAVEPQSEAVAGLEGLQFTMSALPAGVLDLVVSGPYQRRLCRLLEQRFNTDDTAADVASVEYIGRMVTMTAAEDMKSRTWTVVLQTEQFDADSRRARNIRYSDAEQQRRYPGDLGAEFAAGLEERVMTRQPA
jgi:hypothetical protein